MKKAHIRSTLYDFTVHLIILFAVIATVFPLLYVISASLSNPDYVAKGYLLLLPRGLYIESYRTIFLEPDIWRAYYNTIWYTVVGTTLNIVFTMLAAYPLTRRNFFARGFFTFIFVFTMFFSGGLIPSFILVAKLGLYDTRWAMVLPGLISVWNLIICRTYIQTSISEELIESAKIEGSSEFKILKSIITPLSKPIIATLVIFYGIGHWNSFFNALIFLKSYDLHPLQLYLRRVLLSISPELIRSQAIRMDESTLKLQKIFMQIKFSMIVVSIIPILLIYPFVQKYFVKGIMIGSLKG